ncbi:Transposase, partial [Dysosmobacter welbionis]
PFRTAGSTRWIRWFCFCIPPAPEWPRSGSRSASGGSGTAGPSPCSAGRSPPAFILIWKCSWSAGMV